MYQLTISYSTLIVFYIYTKKIEVKKEKTTGTSKATNQESLVPTAKAVSNEEPTKPDSAKEQALLQQSEPVKKKIRWTTDGNANQFDLAVDRNIICGSAIANVRRQQLKVIEAFKDHITCMETFKEEGDDRVHFMITNYLKLKADFKSLTIPEEDRAKMVCKPGLWEAEGVVDPNSFHFGHNLFSYHKYIK